MSFGVSSIYRSGGGNRMPRKYRQGAIHGPTVIIPKQPKPVKAKRPVALRTAWTKHFPHLRLSVQDYHRLSKVPYSAALIDVALGKTAAAAAFGSNKQYDASGVINYAGEIARRSSGNSPLPKRPYRRSTHDLIPRGTPSHGTTGEQPRASLRGKQETTK